jgi:tricorn protease-like protein
MGMYLLLKLILKDDKHELYRAVNVETQEESEVQASPLGTLFYVKDYSRFKHGGISLQWSPDGRFIGTRVSWKGLSVWSPFSLTTQSGKKIAAGKDVVSFPKNLEGGVAWSPTKFQVATGYEKTGFASAWKGVSVWDLDTGQSVADFPTDKTDVRSVGWSRDGKYLVAGESKKKVLVWDVASGQRIQIYEEHEKASLISYAIAVAWSPDGTRIASATDKSVRVWDAKTGKTGAVIADPRGVSVDWSPDGTRLVTIGADSNAIIADAKTGRQILAYKGHTSGATMVTWSPDGSRIASAHYDRTINLWDAGTGQRLFKYDGHSGVFQGSLVTTMAWSPDGITIASGDEKKRIHVWQAA